MSTFDHALLGSIPPAVYVHDSDLLEEVSRILKPSAGISIREPVVREGKLLTVIYFIKIALLLILSACKYMYNPMEHAITISVAYGLYQFFILRFFHSFLFSSYIKSVNNVTQTGWAS